MGGIKDALFGSTKDPKFKKENMFTGGQNDLLDSLVGLLQNNLGQGAEVYGGQLTPGASDIQSQVFGAAGDWMSELGQGQDYGRASRGVINRFASGAPSMTATAPGAVSTERNQYASPYDAQGDQEYWQKAFVDPAMKQWSERIAPQVQEKFIANNIASSSGANNALSRSAGDMMTNLTGQLAGIMQGNKQTADQRAFSGEENYINRLLGTGEAAADRQMGAQSLNAQLREGAMGRMGQIPGFEATLKNVEDPTEQLMNMLGIGNMQRGIESEQLQEPYYKWQQGQEYNNPWLKLLGMTGGTSPYQGYVQPGSQQSGLLQDVVAPVAGGAMSSNGFWKWLG